MFMPDARLSSLAAKFIERPTYICISATRGKGTALQAITRLFQMATPVSGFAELKGG